MTGTRKLLGVGALAAIQIVITVSTAVAQPTVFQGSERRLVLPGGRTTGLQGSYWAAALSDGRSMPRHERLLIVGPDGRILDVVDGSEQNVQLPVGISLALEKHDLHVTLVHNHPLPVGLSGEDLRQLARTGVDRVIAVAGDGAVYEAAPGPGVNLLAAGLYETVLGRMRDRVTTESVRSGESLETLYPHLCHLVSVVLHRAKVIDYRVTPSVTARAAFERYHDLFERVATVETLILEKDFTQTDRRPSASRRRD